jgi:hypothetical protein
MGGEALSQRLAMPLAADMSPGALVMLKEGHGTKLKQIGYSCSYWFAQWDVLTLFGGHGQDPISVIGFADGGARDPTDTWRPPVLM